MKDHFLPAVWPRPWMRYTLAGRQTGKRAQRHDGAGPVKPAPGDPQPFGPLGRLALGKPPKLRIHRLGKNVMEPTMISAKRVGMSTILT